MVGSSAGRPA